MLSYITTYGLMILYYYFFFRTVKTGFKKGSGQLEHVLAGKGEPGVLFTRLISGIFLLGIGTATLFLKINIDTAIFIFSWDDYTGSVLIIIFAAMIIGFSSAFRKVYPGTNSSHSLPSYLPLSYVLIRILFMIVYEFFFRGMMLFIMIADIGVVAAVIVNIVLYVAVHWFDKKERYGSLLMGVVLCGISIYYNSVWPAIIVHLSLALSNEITLLINNKSLIKKSLS